MTAAVDDADIDDVAVAAVVVTVDFAAAAASAADVAAAVAVNDAATSVRSMRRCLVVATAL